MMRKVSPIGWKRAALTALMAYALVLQTLLASLGGAAHAAQASGPQGILCLQDGRTQGDHAPATAHDGLCCTLSCYGAGPAGPTPDPTLAQRLTPTSILVRASVVPSLTRLSSNVLPVGSRAPPRLV